MRRVGTLTVRGDVPPRGALAGGGLRWSDVADLLALEPVTPAVAAVAEDLRALIEGMFGPVIAPPGFLEAGSSLTKDLADAARSGAPVLASQPGPRLQATCRHRLRRRLRVVHDPGG